MTVSTATVRVNYTGNGITTVFPVPFRFLANADLRVLRTVIATGVSTTLTLDSTGPDGYSVIGAGEPAGGAITVETAPAGTSPDPALAEQLTILLDIAISQDVSYIFNDPFPAKSHERALDKLTLILQQFADRLSRMLSAASGDTAIEFTYDSQNRRIRRVASATESGDAVPYGQVLSMIGGTAPLVAGDFLDGDFVTNALVGLGLPVYSVPLVSGRTYRIKIIGTAQNQAVGTYGFVVRMYSADGLSTLTTGRALNRDQASFNMLATTISSLNGSNPAAEAGFQYLPDVENEPVSFDVEFVTKCTASGTLEFRFGSTTGADAVQLDKYTTITVEELPFV